jgi:hypothetical protein
MTVEPHTVCYIQPVDQVRLEKGMEIKWSTLATPKGFAFPAKDPGLLVDHPEGKSVAEICRTRSEVHNPKQAIPFMTFKRNVTTNGRLDYRT